MLFPEAKKDKGFSDLIKVISGSPSLTTLEVLGMEITFGWATIDGKKKFIEISRSKDSRILSPGSTDIPADLYNALRKRAIAVTNSSAETKRSKVKKQQLNNQIKKKQPDLF